MRQHNQALGIRTASRVQTLGAADVTLRGTYWYDLRARRPLAAAVKRAIDVVISAPLIALAAPLFLFGKPTREKRVGFRGHEFEMYSGSLAQLLNVLEGTMSLVGPRPMLPYEEQHSDARRFSVAPGITGPWRIESGDERQLDREYVNEWSVGRDLRILARTVTSRRPAASRR